MGRMSDGSFGRYLLTNRVVTEAQWARAQEIQRDQPFLRIGEILMGLGYISLFNLIKHLSTYRSSAKIGELLVMEGVVTREQLEEALEIQATTGRIIGKILVEMNACTIVQLTQVLSLQRGSKLPVTQQTG